MNRAWLALRPWRRHSLVVGIGGMVYVLYGLTFFIPPVTEGRASALRLAFYLPPAVWGVVWTLVGLLAIASTRWPPASETWGYTTMTGLSALWGLFYAFGIPLGAPVAGLTGFLVWVLVAFLWWGIAGLRNPDDVPKER